MSVRIERTDLPGIGARYDVVTAGGRRVGVVAHRSGERDLALFDADDPDSCADSIPLTDQEAAALADVLGGSVMVGTFAGLSAQEAGLYTEHLQLPTDSRFVDRPLGATKARTRTGVSIVAIVRDRAVIASPTPEQPLAAGDSLVAVGTRRGLSALADLIADGTR